jgi:hypothetical protein
VKRLLIALLLVGTFCAGATVDLGPVWSKLADQRDAITELQVWRDAHQVADNCDPIVMRELRCNQQRLQWTHPEMLDQWGWCEPEEGIQ